MMRISAANQQVSHEVMVDAFLARVIHELVIYPLIGTVYAMVDQWVDDGP